MSVAARNKTKLSGLGEFGLIDLIKKNIRQPTSIIRGIGDDGAVVSVTKNKNLLITTDMLVEGVHFNTKMSAKAIGRKAVACSVSDIAAMGGTPKFAVVSLGIPASCSARFVLALYQGMNAMAKEFKVTIVGGDTVRSHKIVINVALTGEVGKSELITRARLGLG